MTNGIFGHSFRFAPSGLWVLGTGARGLRPRLTTDGPAGLVERPLYQGCRQQRRQLTTDGLVGLVGRPLCQACRLRSRLTTDCAQGVALRAKVRLIPQRGDEQLTGSAGPQNRSGKRIPEGARTGLCQGSRETTVDSVKARRKPRRTRLEDRRKRRRTFLEARRADEELAGGAAPGKRR